MSPHTPHASMSTEERAMHALLDTQIAALNSNWRQLVDLASMKQTTSLETAIDELMIHQRTQAIISATNELFSLSARVKHLILFGDASARQHLVADRNTATSTEHAANLRLLEQLLIEANDTARDLDAIRWEHCAPLDVLGLQPPQ
ncbi:hypothetical protein BC828DRAFT_409295 [Blastocladiella britannica]|nr:hypothetical protein BC828DRAFT_409295 [Blastocladiella britannica]